MTCIVILEVTAKKGTGKQLVETFRTLLPDTRNKDGCQGVEVTINLDDADNLVLVERWATRKHYENYLAWRHSVATSTSSRRRWPGRRRSAFST